MQRCNAQHDVQTMHDDEPAYLDVHHTKQMSLRSQYSQQLQRQFGIF